MSDDEVAAGELRLLRSLWDFAWNELGTTDGGDHVQMTWAEDQRMSDLCEAVDDYYIAHPDRRP